jgi:hypothetical protein
MRDLAGIRDGEQGAVRRFTVKDTNGLPRDFSSAACEVYVEDDSHNLLAVRPGVIVGVKSAGQVDVFLRGAESDWDGLGKRLVYVPKLYYAAKLDKTPAVQLLTNPSFDAATGTSPARLPDSWTLVGARTATWDNHRNDAIPPAIYATGTIQTVLHAGVVDPDYLQQTGALAFVAGDYLSWGIWCRHSGGAGEAANDTHAMLGKMGANANTVTRFRIGDQDWYYVTGEVRATQNESAWTVAIDHRGTTLLNRIDEATAFSGRFQVFYGERKRVQVHERARAPKTANQIAGYGGFETDSNGDGIADAWGSLGTGGTFTLEKNLANVAEGLASQKIVLSDQSARSLRLIWRMKVKNGETWRFRLKEKTAAALSGGVGTGGFTIGLSTEACDGALQSATTALTADTAGAYADHSVSLAVTANRNALVLDINLNGKTGSLFLDDARLDRTVAAP